MYKTIIAVVVFLFIALAVQLYEQRQIQARIELQQQEAEKARAEIQKKIAGGADPNLAPATDAIAPEMFSVPNGSPKEFSVDVDTSKMTDVAIAGHFAVSDKRTRGVEVYVFDEEDYMNWLYGNNATAIFSSGQELMGDVRVRIAKSGRYYLVFRNPSSVTAVNIQANIRMQYEKVTSS